MISVVDISSWNKNPDLHLVQAAGYSGVLMKATQGTTYVSDRFLPEWKEAESIDLAHTAYHFNRFEVDAEKQAAFFLAALVKDGIDPSKQRLAWDVEPYDLVRDMQPAVKLDHALVGLRFLARETGLKPLVYLPGEFFFECLHGYAIGRKRFVAAPNAMELTEYPLWLANYAPTPRAMPWPLTPWGTSYTLWQRSGHAEVPGVVGDCDLNEFPGTEAEFRRMLAGDLLPSAIA